MTHPLPAEIRVLFVSGFGPVVAKQNEAEGLYRHLLHLPLEAIDGYDGYFYAHTLQGVKHFALWPLSKAAESCFGKPEWPQELPVPQAWLEMDVEDIEKATLALERAGYTLLTRMRQEPWGQTVTRFLSPEGILMAVAYTPDLRGTA